MYVCLSVCMYVGMWLVFASAQAKAVQRFLNSLRPPPLHPALPCPPPPPHHRSPPALKSLGLIQVAGVRGLSLLRPKILKVAKESTALLCRGPAQKQSPVHSDCWILAPARSRLKNSLQQGRCRHNHPLLIRHIHVQPGRGDAKR